MAENATPAKIAATRGYGAEVVLHGTIWDEANEKANEAIWKSVNGRRSDMPAPRHDYIIGSQPADPSG